MTGLDREPYWSSEAQETFAEGCRVFAVADTICAREGSEGTYVGRTKHGPMILWDTPDGRGYAETVHWDAIRNLYR